MRYFIEIAYNGKNYHGWQRQPNAHSVQEELEDKLSIFFRHAIHLVGAGRTDAGVHAKQLFAHFDVEEISTIAETVFKLNSFLPRDISIQNIFKVRENAHARFDAIEREYEYHICTEKNPFLTELAYQLHQKPTLETMNEAAKLLLKYNDFKCFSRSNTDVKTFVCDVRKASWKEENKQLIFTITADRFLRNMVRAVVGTLLDVGFEKISLEKFKAIIESGNRENAGPSAPAHGLYLTRVSYPESIFL